MNMRNIVLDTNSLIIAISAKNDCHKVWQSFLNGDYTLCISNENRRRVSGSHDSQH